jgi:hypothetical protein
MIVPEVRYVRLEWMLSSMLIFLFYQSFGILHAMNPDPYRGLFGNDATKYSADLQDLILSATSGCVAGFMAETIQGVGGATPLVQGYLPAAYKVIHAVMVQGYLPAAYKVIHAVMVISVYMVRGASGHCATWISLGMNDDACTAQ